MGEENGFDDIEAGKHDFFASFRIRRGSDYPYIPIYPHIPSREPALMYN